MSEPSESEPCYFCCGDEASVCLHPRIPCRKCHLLGRHPQAQDPAREADLSAAARALGARGGKAGRGESQRRGDSAYYKALRAKRKR